MTAMTPNSTSKSPAQPTKPVRTLSDGVANPKQGSGARGRPAPSKSKDD